MKTIAEILPRMGSFQEKENPRETESKTELTATPKNSALVESIYQPADELKLSQALGACLLAQRTYGKQGDDIGKITKIFVKVLSQHSPEKVIQAVKEWLVTSPEFPTPADIEGILNPKPKFDYALFNSLSERLRRGEQLNYTQLEYIKAYEQNAMRGL